MEQNQPSAKATSRPPVEQGELPIQMAVVDALDVKIQSGEFLIPLDILRRTPITKKELLSKSRQRGS